MKYVTKSPLRFSIAIPSFRATIRSIVVLLEAERIAREREPGNGAAQTPVLAQLAAAID